MVLKSRKFIGLYISFIIIFNFILLDVFAKILKGSSPAIGLFIAISIFILFTSLLRYFHASINTKYFYIVLILISFICLHFFIATFIFENMNFYKFYFSLFFLFFILIISAFFVNFFVNIEKKYLDKTMRIVFWILSIIGFLSIILIRFKIAKYFSSDPKFMIIFSEPSHYALTFIPFLFYEVYVDKNKFLYLFISFFIAVAVRNSTLLVGNILIIFTFYSFKKTIAIMFILILIFLSLDSIENFKLSNYFLSRFMLNNNNLSVLVFLSGWNRAFLSLLESYGWGLGFQQFGFVGHVGYYQHLISAILPTLSKLNLYDGGTTGSKFIAEFGIFGIITLIIYLKIWVGYLLKLRRSNINSNKELFFISFYFMYIIDIFIRGMNYFDLPTFMLLSSIYFLLYKNFNYKKSTSE